MEIVSCISLVRYLLLVIIGLMYFRRCMCCYGVPVIDYWSSYWGKMLWTVGVGVDLWLAGCVCYK